MATKSSRWTNLVSRDARRAVRGAASRKASPTLEVFEKRELMTGAVSSALNIGVLAGNAYVDVDCNQKFTKADTPLSGVKVELYQTGSACAIRSTTTDAQGFYKFEGLAAGDYTIKQITPSGYTSSSSQAVSQIAASSSVSAGTIKATVADPSSLFISYSGVDTDRAAYATTIVNGEPYPNAFGPMKIAVGSIPGATDVADGYLSFCVNNEQSISVGGGEIFQVYPRSMSELTGENVNSGRIAYLFNQYAGASLDATSGPALQLAIWELMYDGGTSPDFAGGNFAVTTALASTTQDELDAIIAKAAAFYDESAGRKEAAIFLETATASPTDQQSMLARGSYNFGYTKNPVTPPPTNNCNTTWFWNLWCAPPKTSSWGNTGGTKNNSCFSFNTGINFNWGSCFSYKTGSSSGWSTSYTTSTRNWFSWC